MVKSLIVICFFSASLVANSLYSDTLVDDISVDEQQLEDSYNYSEDYTQQNKTIAYLMDTYITSIFHLSQLTAPISKLTSESSIYSHISRLQFVAKELKSELDKVSVELDSYTAYSQNYLPYYSQIDNLNQIQSELQETVYKFHVLSPYIPTLLYHNQEGVGYQIEYLERITAKLNSEIMEMAKVSNQLSIGKGANQLPFQPQSPEQISFALQQQLNQSVINMVGGSSIDASSSMPYSSLASPSNADFFNMNGEAGLQQSISTPNGSPLQQMQYIPSF